MEAWAEVWVERSEGGGVPSWTLLKLDRESLGLLFFFHQWQITRRRRVTYRSDSPSITLSRSCRYGPVEDVVS